MFAALQRKAHDFGLKHFAQDEEGKRLKLHFDGRWAYIIQRDGSINADVLAGGYMDRNVFDVEVSKSAFRVLPKAENTVRISVEDGPMSAFRVVTNRTSHGDPNMTLTLDAANRAIDDITV